MYNFARQIFTISMTHFTRILLSVLSLIAALAAQASGTGIFRTAIVLKNGTMEIFPDTLVNKFQYTQSLVQGKVTYSLDVIQDGKVAMSIPIDNIAEINYREMTPYEHFAGDWYFVASPNGEPQPGSSIMVSTVMSTPYHYDESTGKGSISMVLDDQHPVSATQYTGDASTYAYWDATSTWYFGVSAQHEGGDTGGRHMYFVTHNIDTWELEGHELPCQWTLADLQDFDHEFSFPSIYEICWVVGLDIPFVYAEHDLIGYIDIFASPRLMRHPWTKPLTE